MSAPDQYRVFGNPIAQSKSPQIHALFAQQTAQNLTYDKQLVDVDGFNAAATAFFSGGGKGLNITSPFKSDAFHFADELTERAKLAEAVNTLSVMEDGRVRGDTTDGAGLVWDLTERLGWSLHHARVLILGAGGAVRGVLEPILNAQPESVLIANRTASKAEALADRFSQCEVNGCGLSDIPAAEAFDIIINGSSASLSGASLTLPDTLYEFEQVKVYDMVYGAELTPFLKHARDAGAAEVSDGFGMLIGQAAESFRQWRGVKPDAAKAVDALRALIV